MGFFDILRKKRPSADLVPLSYMLCYQTFPPSLFSSPEKFIADLENNTQHALLRRITVKFLEDLGGLPDKDVLSSYTSQILLLKQGIKCILISYPWPPDTTFKLEEMEIPAPYFSAIVYKTDDPCSASYYVLEKSISGPRTVFRAVTADSQLNLGDGCHPDKESFLSLLRRAQP